MNRPITQTRHLRAVPTGEHARSIATDEEILSALQWGAFDPGSTERIEHGVTKPERGLRLWVVCAGVAVALLALVLVFVPRSEASERVQGANSPAPDRQKEHGRITLSSGAQLVAGEGASFRVEEGHEANEAEVMVFLSSGEVSLNATAPGDGALTVRTPHTDVLAHGARFAVSVSEGPRPQTQVQVSEGFVSVMAQGGLVFLRAGESWASERFAEFQL